MRSISLCLICALTSVAGPARAQQSPDAESFDRIREALLKPPPRLWQEVPRADFSIVIEQRRPLQDIFKRPPWVSPPPELPPLPGRNRNPHDAIVVSASIDPYALAHSASRTLRTRLAKGEFQRVIAEYCSAHQHEPGAEAICGPPR